MKKITFLVRIFNISPCVFIQISSRRSLWMRNLILHPMSTHTAYFWQNLICQNHAVWLLVGCRIKFHIQRALVLEIWIKTHGDMLKIRTKKVVFVYDKYVNSTMMVDSFYWNSIGSWIPTHKIYCWRVFL